MEHLFQNVERLSSLLGEYRDQDEQNGCLSETVINALNETGLYKLFLPVSLGGLEADPVTTAKLMECVARFNPAAAWSVMVMNAGVWWSKYLPAQTVEDIFDKSPCDFFAGTFAAAMTAARTEGGFVVNGQTPLCSNVQAAKWVTVLSVVTNDGQPVINNGMPEMRMIVMKTGDFRIVKTWDTFGMKATDSNDVAASNLFIPEYRSGIISPDTANNKYYTGHLYRFPAVGINGCCLIVPVAIAIAATAVNALKLNAEKTPSGSAITLKEKGSYQRKLGMAEALVRSARACLHQSLFNCWHKVQEGETATLEDKADLLLAAAQATKSCVEAVDLVYSASGTEGVYKRSRVSRCFTDMQVIRQHGFANENRFETAAQLLLGSQPDFLPAVL